MSKQNEKNEEDALIAIIKSIREECRVVHKNKQISPLEANLKKSSETMEDTINNDSFISNLPYQPSLEELNPGSFLLPFTLEYYNSYVIANIDASNNVMPRSIYEYLKLANLGGPLCQNGYLRKTIPRNHSCPEICILGRISLGISEDRIKFDVNGNPRQSNITRNYDTIDPHNEIAGQTNPLLDKRGLTKRWHVCKPVQVFYDDESGEDCGMWPTCDPNSSFCYDYKEIFGKKRTGNA
ncbi:hypothetical protein Tco_1220342 [Tanacetum coccineum]